MNNFKRGFNVDHYQRALNNRSRQGGGDSARQKKNPDLEDDFSVELPARPATATKSRQSNIPRIGTGSSATTVKRAPQTPVKKAGKKLTGNTAASAMTETKIKIKKDESFDLYNRVRRNQIVRSPGKKIVTAKQSTTAATGTSKQSKIQAPTRPRSGAVSTATIKRVNRPIAQTNPTSPTGGEVPKRKPEVPSAKSLGLKKKRSLEEDTQRISKILTQMRSAKEAAKEDAGQILVLQKSSSGKFKVVPNFVKQQSLEDERQQKEKTPEEIEKEMEIREQKQQVKQLLSYRKKLRIHEDHLRVSMRLKNKKKQSLVKPKILVSDLIAEEVDAEKMAETLPRGTSGKAEDDEDLAEDGGEALPDGVFGGPAPSFENPNTAAKEDKPEEEDTVLSALLKENRKVYIFKDINLEEWKGKELTAPKIKIESLLPSQPAPTDEWFDNEAMVFHFQKIEL